MKTAAASADVASTHVRHRRGLPRALWLALFVGVALRVLSALAQGDVALPLPGVSDQVSYDALARRVLAGHGFTFAVDWWPATRAGEPTAHWSYVYTLWLAVFEAVGGQHPLVPRIAQAILSGVLHPLLAWWLGARIFGDRAGQIAAWLSAVYLYFVYYAGALMTETFTILAILWTLKQAISIVDSSGASADTSSVKGPGAISTMLPWTVLGLAMGLAALLRQVTLMMAPVIVLWLIWARRDRTTAREADQRSWLPTASDLRTTARGLAATIAVIVLLIVPWTVRNFLAFGRPVVLNTNAGYAFYWANHPIHGTDFIPILPNETYHSLIPEELLPLDEASLDAALLRRGVQFVLDDPGRYLVLSLSRIRELFKFWPADDSGTVSNIVRVLSFGVALPFILIGLWLGIGMIWRHDDQSRAVLLLIGYAVAYTLVHLLSWALIRYRLPVDAILLLFAGLALARMGRTPIGGSRVGRSSRGS